jgi:beta-lactamase superfamily II metal-dependent hydrolase
LDIYWIDVEGGAATLLVTAAGESVLIDSGNPGHRDPDRIARVARRNAGINRIDHLITTHYHSDHFGGAALLSEMIPIINVWDNGDFEKQTEFPSSEYTKFNAKQRHQIAIGQNIPLAQMDGQTTPLSLRCLGARQKVVAADDASKPNERCGKNEVRPEDPSDNANSVVMLLSFGEFDFLDTGDLTWNREFNLVCPVNRVGQVDVFQASHHGLDVSNNPVLIESIAPHVAVINNGATKGCMPMMFAALKETKSVQAIYQMHKNLRPNEATVNTSDDFIANLEGECKGSHIHLSVNPDGKSYEILIDATDHKKTYQSQ